MLKPQKSKLNTKKEKLEVCIPNVNCTSDILSLSSIKSLNQLIDWLSIGNNSPTTTPNPQPSKMKFSIRGRKGLEVSKEAPKRANKKETKGHTTLTLELSTMKTQK